MSGSRIPFRTHQRFITPLNSVKCKLKFSKIDTKKAFQQAKRLSFYLVVDYSILDLFKKLLVGKRAVNCKSDNAISVEYERSRIVVTAAKLCEVVVKLVTVKIDVVCENRVCSGEVFGYIFLCSFSIYRGMYCDEYNVIGILFLLWMKRIRCTSGRYRP